MQELEKVLRRLYSSEALRVMSVIDHLDAKSTSVYKMRGPSSKKVPIGSIYVTYPDGFGNDLDSLRDNLERIRTLGCSMIHILPFLESPLVDEGFDVKDFLKVRKDLGGNAAFRRLLKKAGNLGMDIFMDLICNHVSDTHIWFKKAQEGSEKYRNFFIHSREKPNFLGLEKTSEGTYGIYNFDGKRIRKLIIFPEQAGSIPHWVKGGDGYWYFHTFYPHQIDLDWNNPDVFIEFVRIISYWASKGLSFREDAIIFIGKDHDSDELVNGARNKLLVKAIYLLVKRLNPESELLLEATLRSDELKNYFGRDPSTDLVYNFPLMQGLWASLVAGNADHLWKALDLNKTIANHCVTFLRSHDQLIMLNSELGLERLLRKRLLPLGMPFMDGKEITGRTASFLEEDDERIIMAHLLLASCPGIPAIYYGDELGVTNNFSNLRKSSAKKGRLNIDTRDLNRGRVLKKYFRSGKSIEKALSQIFNVRADLVDRFRLRPVRLDAPKGLFAARYGNLIVIINLGSHLRKSSFKGEVILSVNGAEKLVDGTVSLPPHGGVWLLDKSVWR